MNTNETVVLYDSDCGFCNWCRRFVEYRDQERRIRFVGLTEPEADALIHRYDITVDRNDPESIATITPDGRIFYKWRGCVELCRLMRTPYRQLYYPLRLVPPLIGDWFYNRVSNNRNFLCRLVRCTKETDSM